MNALILDSITEDSAKCYLCSLYLKDYVENLPSDYKDYEIQREIVTNTYLDNLVNTVLRKAHIPPIVLIAEEFKEENEELLITNFKILDGLQRTYRLYAIWKTIELFLNEIKESQEILELNKLLLTRRYNNKLQEIDSSTKVLQVIIQFYKENHQKEGFNLLNTFSDNKQWFEVWTGLNPDDEVNKMLVLNAGHKPVKIKHQLELIFRNLIPILHKIDDIKFEIFREKQISAIQFSKERKARQYHFSHLISSLLSLMEGKPITTNSALIQKLQETDFNLETDTQYFRYEPLKKFISYIVDLDEKAIEVYKNLGLQWLGREVAMVGIFGALGKYGKNRSLTTIETLELIPSKIIPNFFKYNLEEFESVRNQQNLAKVNIGNVNKNAINEATYDILNDKVEGTISWEKYF